MKTTEAAHQANADLVGGILQEYADRGVFRAFSRGPSGGPLKILWHRDRVFELALDTAKHTLRFPVVLPDIPPKSEMFHALQDFVAERQSGDLPAHRTIDPAKAKVRCVPRGGHVGVTMNVLDDDYEYATRKLIHLVHEIYMVFLIDGPYFEYMVEAFNLDPDRP